MTTSGSDLFADQYADLAIDPSPSTSNQQLQVSSVPCATQVMQLSANAFYEFRPFRSRTNEKLITVSFNAR